MKKLFSLRTSLTLILAISSLIACQDDEFKKRYEDPPWLGGSNLETLKLWTANSNGVKDSSFNHFIDLMRVSEYYLDMETSLFTLFAPSDRAFEEFFAKHGIDSCGDLTQPDAERIMTLHFLRNPLSRYYLVYTYKYDQVMDEDSEYGPLFFRQQTRSVAPTYTDYVRYNEEFLGEELHIRGDIKYLCLFSSELIETISAVPSDYEFICRDTKWSKSGLNWHNAEILKAEHPTSDGYIYTIDRVMEHPPSVNYYLMENQDRFGLFYDLMQRFAFYEGRRLDINGYYTYLKGYTEHIFNLDTLWGPNSSWQIEKDIFTALVPRDDVLQQYLESTFLKSFASIDEIPDATIAYLINAHITRNMLMASKMEKLFLNNWGDEFNINTQNDIEDSYLCSNGVVFEMNRVLAPGAFTLAPGPLFFNSEYTTFLSMLLLSGDLLMLTQPEVPVTIFATDNAAMLKAGFRIEEETKAIQILRANDRWENITQDEIEEYMEDHIAFTGESDFSGEGFFKLSSNSYIKYDNGTLQAGGNAEEGETVTIASIEENETNGTLFLLDSDLKAPKKTKAMFIMDDPELSDFRALMDSAGLITTFTDPDTEEEISTVSLQAFSEEWTAFIPTNAALATNPIPAGADIIAFINYHFVQNVSIFDDGNLSGEFSTASLTEQVGEDFEYAKINIDNQFQTLTLIDQSGQEIVVPHSTANNLVIKGVVHKIGTPLLYSSF